MFIHIKQMQCLMAKIQSQIFILENITYNQFTAGYLLRLNSWNHSYYVSNISDKFSEL